MIGVANEDHLTLVKLGVDAWNHWKDENPEIQPDFSEADLSRTDLSEAKLWGANIRVANLRMANLSGADLCGANLCAADLSGATPIGANLTGADLIGANLSGANFSGANLSGAHLMKADLSGAYLSGADLRGAHLGRANLSGANLNGANLSGANLSGTQLIETNLANANLQGCRIYGISALELNLDRTNQANLIITREGEPTIATDNLGFAQFIYLLLNDKKMHGVISSISCNAVLIMGSFKPERLAILDAILDEIRDRSYLPIVFDFETSLRQDLTETISRVAGMARFIIADFTDPRSIPDELQTVLPDIERVPIQPILHSSAQRQYSFMFRDLQQYPWVLEPYFYESSQEAIASLKEKIINPAEAKARLLGKARS